VQLHLKACTERNIGTKEIDIWSYKNHNTNPNLYKILPTENTRAEAAQQQNKIQNIEQKLQTRQTTV
jgi:hypothetical protein